MLEADTRSLRNPGQYAQSRIQLHVVHDGIPVLPVAPPSASYGLKGAISRLVGDLSHASVDNPEFSNPDQ